MKAEAEANAEADRKAKEEADKINTADAQIFNSEKQLKEYGDKLPAEKKEAIEKALNELKDAHKERDFAKIDTTLTTLNNAWTAASEEMYKATQEQAQGAGAPPPGDQSAHATADANVTDVDFEEVKDEKK